MITHQSWSQNAINSITQDLLSKNWDILEMESLDSAYNTFIEYLQSCIARHVPSKKNQNSPKKYDVLLG